MEAAVVSRYDRGDDGQSEPDAVAVGDSFIEAGERFEQGCHLRPGDEWPGICDREVGLALVGACFDLHRAGGHVVANGVVHEVCDDALDEDAVAEGGGRRQVGFDDDIGGSSASAGFVDSVLRRCFEVHKFSGGQAPVGPGQGQEAVDDCF